MVFIGARLDAEGFKGLINDVERNLGQLGSKLHGEARAAFDRVMGDLDALKRPGNQGREIGDLQQHLRKLGEALPRRAGNEIADLRDGVEHFSQALRRGNVGGAIDALHEMREDARDLTSEFRGRHGPDNRWDNNHRDDRCDRGHDNDYRSNDCFGYDRPRRFTLADLFSHIAHHIPLKG